MQTSTQWVKGVAVVVLLAFGSLSAHAAPPTAIPQQPVEKQPVAVLWMGDDEGDLAARVIEEINAALARKETVRPLDSIDDRRVLATGGPSAKVTAEVRDAESLLARAKLADAAGKLEAAEAHLLSDVPFESLRSRLGEVERGLLAVYDQLGRADDAARAGARLRMAPGSVDDVKVLLERHSPAGGIFGATLPPVEIVSDPPGAQVYRDLLPACVTPCSVDGGERAVDFIDVEAPGRRRAHAALGMGGRLELPLLAEDRLGVIVDHVRDQAPDAKPVDVAALGKRVGAVRVLIVLPDGPRKLLARWLDVKTAKWSDATLRVDNAGQTAMERLAGYASLGEGSPDGADSTPPPPVPPPQPAKRKLGMWGKWYTWVAAGAVVALVVGLLVAQNVGSDKLTVTSSH